MVCNLYPVFKAVSFLSVGKKVILPRRTTCGFTGLIEPFHNSLLWVREDEKEEKNGFTGFTPGKQGG